MNDASGPVPIDFSLLLFFCFVNPIVFFAFVAGYFARRGLKKVSRRGFWGRVGRRLDLSVAESVFPCCSVGR